MLNITVELLSRSWDTKVIKVKGSSGTIYNVAVHTTVVMFKMPGSKVSRDTRLLGKRAIFDFALKLQDLLDLQESADIRIVYDQPAISELINVTYLFKN